MRNPQDPYADLLFIGVFGTELQGRLPRRLLRSSLRSFRPPTSQFGQPSQTEYSTVSSLQHIWFGARAFSVAGPTIWISLRAA